MLGLRGNGEDKDSRKPECVVVPSFFDLSRSFLNLTVVTIYFLSYFCNALEKSKTSVDNFDLVN